MEWVWILVLMTASNRLMLVTTSKLVRSFWYMSFCTEGSKNSSIPLILTIFCKYSLILWFSARNSWFSWFTMCVVERSKWELRNQETITTVAMIAMATRRRISRKYVLRILNFNMVQPQYTMGILTWTQKTAP